MTPTPQGPSDGSHQPHEDSTEEAAIVRAVLDYFEGWFDGDASRMERALHPGLAKRALDPRGTGTERLDETTSHEMIEATARGEGRRRDLSDRGIEVKVNEVYGTIATVTVHSNVYREYLHLVRTREGWKIVNALWKFTERPPPGDGPSDGHVETRE